LQPSSLCGVAGVMIGSAVEKKAPPDGRAILGENPQPDGRGTTIEPENAAPDEADLLENGTLFVKNDIVFMRIFSTILSCAGIAYDAKHCSGTEVHVTRFELSGKDG
jgi:hypothetical protein